MNIRQIRATLEASRHIEVPNAVNAKANSPLMRIPPHWKAISKKLQAECDKRIESECYPIRGEPGYFWEELSWEDDWPFAALVLLAIVGFGKMDGTKAFSLILLSTCVYFLFLNESSKIR